jgi:hypothetical protein
VIEQTEIQGKEEVPVDVEPGLKLDLACGDIKVKGFTGVDIVQTEEADVVHDLTQVPWPFEDESVTEARCSHFFEHLEPAQRITFMNELYRVLKPEAGCMFITPLGYDRQVQDPSHKWPPVVIGTYLYFDAAWLEANKLSHYRELHGINCDFEMRPTEVGVTPEFALRGDEAKMFASRQYMNAATDLMMLVVKKKKKE